MWELVHHSVQSSIYMDSQYKYTELEIYTEIGLNLLDQVAHHTLARALKGAARVLPLLLPLKCLRRATIPAPPASYMY